MNFNRDILKIDLDEETTKLYSFIQEEVYKVYRRKGIVIGISGGIDSAVLAALSVKALGKDKVVGLILPEKESNPVSSRYAAKHAEALDIEFREIDITPTVDSIGGYSARDEFIKELLPEYTQGCKYNISLPADLLERASFSFYILRVQLPDGEIIKKRMNMDEFRAVTAFANTKIRARMIHLYYEADKRNLIVGGTTNRTEMNLGDYCKYGDGGTDIEPLSYLYKDQIYQLADYLDVIHEIKDRTPSPDTFSLPVSDQEFFFRIPFDKLDLLLYAWEHDITTEKAAEVIDLKEEAVIRAFKDFETKSRATAHLREMPHTLISE